MIHMKGEIPMELKGSKTEANLLAAFAGAVVSGCCVAGTVTGSVSCGVVCGAEGSVETGADGDWGRCKSVSS